MAKAVAEPTETTTEPPVEKARPRFKGPPKKPDRPKILTFMQRIAEIPKDDWGKRATIKIYRIEPVINRLATSDNKYIGIYSEPVNEERVKLDYGSGKYRLYLNYKLPSESEGKELDSVEFDIMDMAHPPKIPLGEWVDAPKNKDWAWAKPMLTSQQTPVGLVAAPTASAAPDFADTIRALNEVQNSAVERAMASAPTAPSLLDTIRAVKDLMPTPAPSTENAVLTTVVTLFTTQLNASQAQTAQLFKELSEMRMAQASKPASTGLETFRTIFGEVKTLLPEIKELFPVADSVRARGPWWVGIAEQAIASAAPAIPFFLQKMATAAPQPGVPGMAPSPPPAITAPQIDVDKLLIDTLNADRDGEDMAFALTTYFGDQGRFIYKQAVAFGEAPILAELQKRPVWAQLGPLQAKMPEFIHDFVEYGKPEVEDAEIVDAEVIE